ncbi:hypothetical protein BBJ28_00019371 [Nothophytophthora sp. Chile5]|nr:hypothetical protein BBJ28_00019371 [Nothophytophthora sp. Chile5]
MASASASDVCSAAVLALYLDDPDNPDVPLNYVLCTEMGSTCETDGCACRHSASSSVNGSTMSFVVCVLLNDGDSCNGTDYVSCSSSSSASIANSAGSSSVATPSASSANGQSSASVGSGSSGSTATDTVASTSTGSSSSTMSTPVMIAIIVICVVFVALVSWFVRSYCLKRAASQDKASDPSPNFNAPSPTHTVGSSTTPASFPAFDRRTRSANSHNSAIAARGQRSVTSQRAVPPTARGQRSVIPQRAVPPTARGQRATSRGQRPPPYHPSQPLQPSRRVSSTTGSSGAAVYTGPESPDGIILFAQQAAFEAPAPPPIGRPKASSRPIQPVRIAEPIPRRSRSRVADPDPRRSAPRMTDGTIPMRSTSSSGKTTVSSAPSVASSATTVVAAGRRWRGQTPPDRQMPVADAAPLASSLGNSRLGTSFDSSIVSSVGTSELAWSTASGLSDNSGYYQPAPSRTAHIPMMDAMSDDEVSELGGFSDWGASTQRSADVNRSTGASSASFFSVNSDFTDDNGSVDHRYGHKEREF